MMINSYIGITRRYTWKSTFFVAYTRPANKVIRKAEALGMALYSGFT